MTTWILLAIILLVVLVVDSRANRIHKLLKTMDKKLDRLAAPLPDEQS